MALVIVGYALAVLSGMASVGPMRLIKYGVLAFSLIYLIRLNIHLLRLVVHYAQSVFILSLVLFLFSVFTPEPLISMVRALTFIVPFLYVALTVGSLLLSYPIKEILGAFLSSINWVYMIPLVSFFLTGGSLSNTNIYFISSENEGNAFVSNHYGWSGTIFLVTGIDLLRSQSLPFWRRWLIIAFCGVAMYLVLISGNRTSWLSLSFVALLFTFRYQRFPIYYKFLLALLPLGLIIFLLKDPKSALNARVKKTEVQAKKGEARAGVARSMITHFKSQPSLWVTGIGIFNKRKIKSITSWGGYHNSYFEVLFGTGLLMFSFFFYLIVIRPGWNFMRFFSEQYLFLPPFMIIPYFESNLTGGQFLFFPWFMMILLMGYARIFAKLKIQIKQWQKTSLPAATP
ncbi:hypothetical protein HNQ92_003110 [Rhabdobacter roseus]|uniref:O-antigen ligase-related domain-containing protein n=1 Tax=Rhabdobacter roseus TaxID=1655419 RepID=A0A840TTT1_9BACT|nr:O-antigen ligase family protein [Rhabdobacter roseus]MBB5284962.1 hypothetical protein [Rhabdobacter roseus]